MIIEDYSPLYDYSLIIDISMGRRRRRRRIGTYIQQRPQGGLVPLPSLMVLLCADIILLVLMSFIYPWISQHGREISTPATGFLQWVYWLCRRHWGCITWLINCRTVQLSLFEAVWKLLAKPPLLGGYFSNVASRSCSEFTSYADVIGAVLRELLIAHFGSQ